MLKGQFILTKKEGEYGKFAQKIGGWILYYDDIEYTIYKDEFMNLRICLLGYIYDWEFPELSAYDILRNMSAYPFAKTDKYSGHFIIFWYQDGRLKIINDCCGQYEVFYDTNFEVFASQPRLIQRTILCTGEMGFYQSEEFRQKRLFVDNTTHFINVEHLKPNHYIDVNQKKVIRFFPNTSIKPARMEDVIPKALEMLKGYIQAAVNRKKLALGLTAGYDTRILFGCTLDIDCEYFVVKTPQMSWNDPDIIIPQRICEQYGKSFKIVYSGQADFRETFRDYKDYQGNSISENIDFPLWLYTAKEIYNDYQILNGTCSEIARRYWDNYYRITPKLLAYLMGYKDKWVIQKYKEWFIKNYNIQHDCNYNIIDSFYWEERHLNFVAKVKPIIFGNRDVWSPFNSRELLTLLLSVPAKDRDYYFNRLYRAWIDYLTPKLKGIPINPFWRTRGIKLMKRLGIYKPYKQLMI